MEINRPVIARFPQVADEALRLAQRISPHEMRALRIFCQRSQQLADLLRRSGWRNTGNPKVASVTNTSQGTTSKGAAVASRSRL